jgi:dipeptidase E
MREKRNIVALGGGGFSIEPENPRLDDFILSLAGASRRPGFFSSRPL